MKRKQLLSIKTVVAIGIGAAIFFILARYLAFPTPIPNTTINTSYAFLALMAVIFGPIAGTLIGFIGHFLTDLFGYGLWWSWIVVSPFVGLFIGLAWKSLDIESGDFGKSKIIKFNIIQAVVQGIGWFLIAPTLDVLIYAEPANKVYFQGLGAGFGNIITVAVIGTLLLKAYSKTRTKAGSLDKDLPAK